VTLNSLTSVITQKRCYITKLVTVFEIFGRTEDAVASFKRAATAV